MSAVIAVQTDIAVYAANGKLQVAVEVKNRRGADADWVIALRRNLYFHGFLFDVPFFLLVLPDKTFLWTPNAGRDMSAPPDYEVATDDLLSLSPQAKATGFVSKESLLLLVASWLMKLARTDLESDAASADWFIKSGFYEAIKNGTVRVEAES